MSELSASSSGFDPVVAQLWIERIARFATANCSVTAFCAAEGIAKSGFFRWRRKLAPQSGTKPTPKRSKPPKTAVVPIRVSPAPAHPHPIELALPSGTVLRLPADTQPEWIVAVLRGWEQRTC